MSQFLLDANIYYWLRKEEFSELLKFLKDHKEILSIVPLNFFEILDTRNKPEYDKRKTVLTVLMELLDLDKNYNRMSSDQIIESAFSTSSSDDIDYTNLTNSAKAIIASKDFEQLSQQIELPESTKRVKLNLKAIEEWKKNLGEAFVKSVNTVISSDIKKLRINKDFNALTGIRDRLNYIYKNDDIFLNFIIPTIVGLAARANCMSDDEMNKFNDGNIDFEKFEKILTVLDLKKLEFFIEVYLYYIKLCWESQHAAEINDLFDLEYLIYTSYYPDLIFVTNEKIWKNYGKSDRIISLEQLSKHLINK